MLLYLLKSYVNLFLNMECLLNFLLFYLSCIWYGFNDDSFDDAKNTSNYKDAPMIPKSGVPLTNWWPYC